MNIEVLVIGSLAITVLFVCTLCLVLAGYRIRNRRIVVVEPAFLTLYLSRFKLSSRTAFEKENDLRRRYIFVASASVAVGIITGVQIVLGNNS
jgi:uncharacterized membrane protein YozB (DUF420 family)